MEDSAREAASITLTSTQLADVANEIQQLSKGRNVALFIDYKHTHTRTHAHTCTHAHMHTHAHTHMRTHTCTHMHTHAHTCAHMHTHTHAHTCTHTRTHAHTCTHMHTHAHTCTCVHTTHIHPTSFTHPHTIHSGTPLHRRNEGELWSPHGTGMAHLLHLPSTLLYSLSSGCSATTWLSGWMRRPAPCLRGASRRPVASGVEQTSLRSSGTWVSWIRHCHYCRLGWVGGWCDLERSVCMKGHVGTL